MSESETLPNHVVQSKTIQKKGKDENRIMTDFFKPPLKPDTLASPSAGPKNSLLDYFSRIDKLPIPVPNKLTNKELIDKKDESRRKEENTLPCKKTELAHPQIVTSTPKNNGRRVLFPDDSHVNIQVSLPSKSKEFKLKKVKNVLSANKLSKRKYMSGSSSCSEVSSDSAGSFNEETYIKTDKGFLGSETAFLISELCSSMNLMSKSKLEEPKLSENSVNSSLRNVENRFTHKKISRKRKCLLNLTELSSSSEDFDSHVNLKATIRHKISRKKIEKATGFQNCNQVEMLNNEIKEINNNGKPDVEEKQKINMTVVSYEDFLKEAVLSESAFKNIENSSKSAAENIENLYSLQDEGMTEIKFKNSLQSNEQNSKNQQEIMKYFKTNSSSDSFINIKNNRLSEIALTGLIIPSIFADSVKKEQKCKRIKLSKRKKKDLKVKHCKNSNLLLDSSSEAFKESQLGQPKEKTNKIRTARKNSKATEEIQLTENFSDKENDDKVIQRSRNEKQSLLSFSTNGLKLIDLSSSPEFLSEMKSSKLFKEHAPFKCLTPLRKSLRIHKIKLNIGGKCVESEEMDSFSDHDKEKLSPQKNRMHKRADKCHDQSPRKRHKMSIRTGKRKLQLNDQTGMKSNKNISKMKKISKARELVKRAKSIKRAAERSRQNPLDQSATQSRYNLRKPGKWNRSELNLKSLLRKSEEIGSTHSTKRKYTRILKKEPSVSAIPLAPIFLSKKQLKEMVEMKAEDPEIVRARREFLMSGVPEALRKQVSVVTQIFVEDPLFPDVSHIQQIDGEEDIWSLPIPDLKLKNVGLWEINSPLKKLKLGSLTKCHEAQETELKKKLPQPESFSDKVIQQLLGELEQEHKKISFRKLYEKYERKKQESEKDTEDTNLPKELPLNSQNISKHEKLIVKNGKKGKLRLHRNKDNQNEVHLSDGFHLKKKDLKSIKELIEEDKMMEDEEPVRRLRLRKKAVQLEDDDSQISSEVMIVKEIGKDSEVVNKSDNSIESTGSYEITVLPPNEDHEKEVHLSEGLQHKKEEDPKSIDKPIELAETVKLIEEPVRRLRPRRKPVQLEDDDSKIHLDEVIIVKEIVNDSEMRNKSDNSIIESTGIGFPELTGLEKDTLWTERYQPTCSDDILGNTKYIRKLKNWLKEWKIITDLENQKTKKKWDRKGVQGKKGLSDSDFITSDSNSDYEDTICNTMLITGPCGCGKTSAVYALAQELGYKVFEVNASSRRSGKRVLTQLQEATQSHQVSKKNLSPGMIMPSLNISTKEPLSSPIITSKKLKNKNMVNKIMASFFQSIPLHKKPISAVEASGSKKQKQSLSVSENETIPLVKKTKKDKKKNVDQKTTHRPTSSNNKGLNLSSTSVILFEDVDLVFEEDDGFWAAINTFMQETKRPIILTTNDATFSSTFRVRSRFEELNFKAPSQEAIVTNLRAICLVENVCTSVADVKHLANFYKGDVRKCLLHAQYCVDSWSASMLKENSVRFEKLVTTEPVMSTELAQIEESTSLPCIETLIEPKIESCDVPLPSVNMGLSDCALTLGLDEPNLDMKTSYQTFCNSADSSIKVHPGSMCWTLCWNKSISDGICHHKTCTLTDKDRKISSVIYEENKPNCELNIRKKTISETLRVISEFTNNIAIINSQYGLVDSSSDSSRWFNGLKPGLSDEISNEEERTYLDNLLTNEIAINKLNQSHKAYKTNISKVFAETSPESISEFELPDVFKKQNRLMISATKAYNEITEDISPISFLNRRVIGMDYLPFLRTICKMENTRQIVNTKRKGRFLHYLSLVGHHVKQDTIEFLSRDLNSKSTDIKS